jgi:hypothetical protein
LVSNGSMEQVLDSLKLLGDEGFSGSPNNEICIKREGDGYTFCYRIQQNLFRRGSRQILSTTAFSEGRVSQAQDGHIVVEGHTQIEPLLAYFFVSLYMLLACLCLPIVQDVYILIPFVFAGLAAYNIFRFYSDYNQAMDGVAEAVANMHNMPENLRSENARQTSRLEQVKNTVHNVKNPG